jgi:hypothetical protein
MIQVENEEVGGGEPVYYRRLDDASWKELRELADKALRFTEGIKDKFAAGWENPGDYPRVDYSVCRRCDYALRDVFAFVALDKDTCVTVIAPRAIEIGHGHVVSKLPVELNLDFHMWSFTLERWLAPATRIDAHTIAVEFEGAAFHVEIQDYSEGDSPCYTMEGLYFGYDGVDNAFAFSGIHDAMVHGDCD